MSKWKTPPFDHQAFCLEKYGPMRAFALNSEMGTGKTWIAIANACELWEQGEIDAVLIFAPNGVQSNWVNLELPKHMPDWVDWKAREWKSGSGVGGQRYFDHIYLADSPRQLRIMAMNWEGLANRRSFDAADKFCETTKRLMIIGDESQNIKNPKSSRYKNLMKLRGWSRYRRTMSGTPITQGPFDAFGQYTFLDFGILGTRSYYAFKAEYAQMEGKTKTFVAKDGTTQEYLNPVMRNIANRMGKDLAELHEKRLPQIVSRDADGLPQYKNLDKLQKLIEPFTFRVLKADCLDLPEKIQKNALFEMTPAQRRAYEKAEEECRLVYENDEVPFAKLTAVMKLAQITSGFFLLPGDPVPKRIEGDNPKLDILVNRVRTIVDEGNKVIIWARFHVEIDDIVAALAKANEKGEREIRVVQYHGDVKAADREAAKIAFQDDPAVNVFVGQQQAGGSGITLTAANFVLYYSNDFSLTNRLQSEDRAHRIGQTQHVTYLNIMARGTIDERVYDALSSKKNVADIINGDGRALGLRD